MKLVLIYKDRDLCKKAANFAFVNQSEKVFDQNLY
jgi:hypothetical protein